MGLYVMNLPDIGEGIAEAEVDEWMVKVGDVVVEDDVLCAVMTDKAVVEVPTSVSGTISWVAGAAGDTLAIGAPLVQIEVDGDGNVDAAKAVETPRAEPEPQKAAAPVPEQTAAPTTHSSPVTKHPLKAGEKPLAPPSVRKRAQESGIDLRMVQGTGPANRISHDDLDSYVEQGPSFGMSGPRAASGGTDIKVKGMRRAIADKMALSKARIPHITVVEEVDVTDLEALRAKLNTEFAADKGKLTILPFVMAAIVKGVAEQPEMNATYDDEAGVIHRLNAVHVGIAAQTPNGLTVPVVRHAEARNLWANAAEVARLSDAARSGKATREDLSGSTITITSLGPLGAIATTPIINHPEVAIVGVNKMAVRPMWDGTDFQPRKMMNISCSFDHRVIDGWDAAVFVQRLKSLLETPALLFIEV